jgi:hypothetical protein
MDCRERTSSSTSPDGPRWIPTALHRGSYCVRRSYPLFRSLEHFDFGVVHMLDDLDQVQRVEPLIARRGWGGSVGKTPDSNLVRRSSEVEIPASPQRRLAICLSVFAASEFVGNARKTKLVQ